MAVITGSVLLAGKAGYEIYQTEQARKDAKKAAKRSGAAQQAGLEKGLTLAKEDQATTQAQFDAAQARRDPFVEGGHRSNEMEQALSGALGPEAQAEAFKNFQASPGQDFLKEEGLRMINSGAGAKGGLGGGTRLKELTRFGQGLAQQSLDSTINRLSNISNRGLTAAVNDPGPVRQNTGLQATLLGNKGAVEASTIMGAAEADARAREDQTTNVGGLIDIGTKLLPGAQ